PATTRALRPFPTRRSSDLEKMSSHFAARRTAHAAAAPPGLAPLPPPPGLRGAPLLPLELREQLAQAERQRIVEALSRCAGNQTRSEEHTSELQSRFDLVCR